MRDLLGGLFVWGDGKEFRVVFHGFSIAKMEEVERDDGLWLSAWRYWG
jgi:hypothetical protein